MSRKVSAEGKDPHLGQESSFLSPTEEELAYLASRDARLGELIALVGPIRRERLPDPFMAIVHAIVGQQVSAAAQASVWRRMREVFPVFTPENLAQAVPEKLRALGLSFRKAGYIANIASLAASGELDLAGLSFLDDESLCQCLCQLPGITKCRNSHDFHGRIDLKRFLHLIRIGKCNPAASKIHFSQF